MNSKPVKYSWLWCPSMLVLVCHFLPGLFEYDRQAPLEFWRFYTSHFVHWDTNHLAWDLLLFIILGYTLIKEDFRVFKLNLLLIPWIISLIMWFAEGSMLFYRGLSGLDAALFTSLACIWIRKEGFILSMIGIIQLLLLSAKIVFEFTNRQAVFASSASYTVIPWAHLAGSLAALFIVGLNFFLSNNSARAPVPGTNGKKSPGTLYSFRKIA